MHRTDREPPGQGRKQAPPRAGRGLTIVELAVAAGVFLVLASVLSVVVAKALGARAAASTRRVAEARLDAALDALAGDFDALVADTFTPPEACPGDDGAGTAGASCLHIGARVVTARYHLDVGADGDARWVELTATADFADGTRLTRTRRVNAPTPGYRPGRGSVRVVLGGDIDRVAGDDVYLLDPAHQAVARAAVSSSGVALFTPPAGACTAASPCHLGLAAGPGYPSTVDGDAALRGADVTAGTARVVAVPGGLTELAATIVTPASAAVTVVAAADDGRTATNPQPGSLCLWGRFDDGGGERSEPFCNLADPATITVADYAPDPAAPEVRVPLPAGLDVALSIDRADGTCPHVDGMVGHTAAGWQPAAVCSSWTWGTPATFSADGGATVPFAQAVVHLGTGAGRYTVTFAGAGARPAAGYGAEALWSKPREAAGCAFDATCTSLGGWVPEVEECPGAHCLSVANFAPEYVSPRTGPGQVATVAVTSSTTTFDVVVTDRDADPVTVTLTAAPQTGTLKYNAAVLSTGQTIVTAAAVPATLRFSYTEPPGQVATVWFTLTITDSHGASTSQDVGLYHSPQTWRLTGEAVTAPQGASNVALAVTATATDGNPRTGATLSFTSPHPGIVLSAATATTDTAGRAQLHADVGDVPAGVYQIAVAAPNGRGGTIALRVTPTAGALGLTATPTVAQGGTGLLTVTAVDRAGAPMGRVAVRLVALDGTEPAVDVYPAVAGCATAADGTCSVAVLVDGAAHAGVYQLRASSGSFTAGAPLTVTQTPAAVGGRAAVAQGGTATLTVTVVDGAGDPVAGVAVTPTGTPGGISLTPAGAVTGPDGQADFGVAAAASARAGDADVAFAAGPAAGTATLTVTPVAASLSGAAAHVDQGGEATVVVTVADGAGDPMRGVPVSFDAPAGSGLRVTPTAVSGVAGQAAAAVQAAWNVAAGTTVTVSAAVDGGPATTVAVTVDAAPASVTVAGAAVQGGTATVAAVVRDGTGTPMPGLAVTAARPGPALTVAAAGPTGPDGVVGLTVTDDGPSPAGTYTVAVDVAGHRLDVALVVAPTVAALDASPAGLTLAAGGSGTVSVTASDLLGAPVRYPRVGVDDADGLDVNVLPGRRAAQVRVAAGPAAGGAHHVVVRAGDAQLLITVSVDG